MMPRFLILTLALILLPPISPAVATDIEIPTPDASEFCHNPVRPVIPTRWAGGRLRPERILYDSFNNPDFPMDLRIFYDITISGDYLFAATGYGMMIFDVEDQKHPLAYPYVAGYELSDLGTGVLADFYLTTIATSPRSHEFVVTNAGRSGLLVLDTTDKNNVRIHYQDTAAPVSSVHVTSIHGREVAFATNGETVRVYNLDVARRCQKTPKNSDCPGAFVGVFRTLDDLKSVLLSGTGDFVVHRGLLDYDLAIVSIYDVSQLHASSEVPSCPPPLYCPPDPPAVTLSITAPARLYGILEDFTYLGDAVLWSHLGHYYLAVAAGSLSGHGEVRIYDVSCIASSEPCVLPDPLAIYSTPDASARIPPLTLSLSRDSRGIPHLYVGSREVFGDFPVCVPQREYLFDVADPSTAVELSSYRGYWGWYYYSCPQKYYTAPRRAYLKPDDDVLYRAAFGFLDSHKLVPPWPAKDIFSDGFEDGSTWLWDQVVP